MRQRITHALFIFVCFQSQHTFGDGVEGYYRFPALRGDTVVFTAEGDLWTAPVSGGLARRLTAAIGEETHAAISPDGERLAFSGTYEGPTEVYTMPISGGVPRRWTYERESSIVNGWTPDGKLTYATTALSTLPDTQLVSLSLEDRTRRRVPLSQASEGDYGADGATLFFVRPAFHNNVTKRYTGGTARQVWRWREDEGEAVKLTTDHPGESHHPMYWDGRVYLVTDRDDVMNLWSIDAHGGDWEQHTHHQDFDVRAPKLDAGRIIYQRAADLWLYDIESDNTRRLPIRLASDLVESQPRWVENPMDYLTDARLNEDGSQVALTARGRVFVAPTQSGRLVRLSREPGVRFREATWMPDGQTVLALSDASGELEFVKLHADGLDAPTPLTDDGETLRYRGIPAPKGPWIAYKDLDHRLYILDATTGAQKRLLDKGHWVRDLAWSPDGRWLAYVLSAENNFAQIWIYDTESQTHTAATSDRVNSLSPAWSPDGAWLYFLSDRNFQSLVGSPWGQRQPEPYFDRKWKIFHIALKTGTRSPFTAPNELEADAPESSDQEGPEDIESESESDKEPTNDSLRVTIDIESIRRRVQEVPLPADNYSDLSINDKALFFRNSGTGLQSDTDLQALEIRHDKLEKVTLVSDVGSYHLSGDGQHALVRKNGALYVIEAKANAVNQLADTKVDLSGWSFLIDTREDWRQLLTDAWRMERDYFYDPGMHGVDWDAMLAKYLPLVDRVTTRNELSDLIGRLIGELSALHTSVRGGDLREPENDIGVANLGARFAYDQESEGFRIEDIYRADPDFPDERSPLDQPGLDIQMGDVVIAINGRAASSLSHPNEALRNLAGKQVRLRLTSERHDTPWDVIVTPMGGAYGLRYRDWEYERRLHVEERSDGRIGYVHLRAMGSSDLAQWYREFYPVFHRQGLIVDVRHNRGGNIDSFILEKLSRRAWMYWKSRDEPPTWNMQYAFRGHMVALVNERTASDGEAFAEGFRRLGLGKLIGTRTWGGEIWLSSVNRLTDDGLARAPMMGVYGPERQWLIEQEGVIPDIEVDNLPHETFNGKDAQLDAAIQHLLERIQEEPREVPPAPPFPDRSLRE